MKKMQKLFEQHPPKRPLLDLDAIVDDWIYRFGKNGLSKHMRDEVVAHCAAAGSFPEAVERAVASLRPNGKMHNHQSRVTLKARLRYGASIMSSLDIERRKRIKTFDALFDHLHDLGQSIEGIGEVTIYDVATRIGAWLHLEVTSLYLHAGVRIGWDLLHGKPSSRALMRVEATALPRALRRIPADECEDMLCAYREYLKPWLATEA